MVARALLLVALALIPSLGNANGTSERINAVTDFLIDRAKSNYLYVFEQRIARDDNVKCYFPKVYDFASHGDMRLLLKGRDLWTDSIRQDMERLLLGMGAKAIAGLQPDQIAAKVQDWSAVVSPYIQVKVGNRFVSLDSGGTAIDEKFRTNLKISAKISEFLVGVGEMAKPQKNGADCELPAITVTDVKALGVKAKGVLDDLKKWMDFVRANSAVLKFDTAKLKQDCQVKASQNVLCAYRDKLVENLEISGKNMLDELQPLIDIVEPLSKMIENSDQIKSNAAMVIQAILLLKKTKTEANDKIAESLKRYVLFFAEVADAEDDYATVKKLLEEYTLPAVSFGIKREAYKGHVTLSAYFGLAYGVIVNSADSDKSNKGGVYVPVGLDLSYGTGTKSSWSLLIAPFDFGYPVSLKINGTQQDVKVRDIVAPSAMLSYGLRNYPISLGIAYQRGRKGVVGGDVEERVMGFVGFDMPLFVLH